MILQRFTVGPFAENCYLIGAPPRVAIVDPGGESERIAGFLDERGWRPEVVLLTHGHIDHIAHVAPLCERYGIGCRIHRDDLFLLRSRQMPEFESMIGARPCPDPEGFLEEGGPLAVAGLELRVLHTPGHSPGGVCLIDDASREMLVGDTLFCRGIGRTDLPGGDFATLGSSIKEKLFAEQGDFRLWPGHGPETRLDEERQENPFFGARICAVSF
ncbi:MAG TPA: MBL fold metallo-hydrolase [Thermoanaerobaculia bacterium]|nr:MBL fold metallo-hydrolase [Thermoanaerobaculia bacterium]